MLWEISVGARNSFAGRYVLCFKIHTVRGKQEFCLSLRRRRAGFERGKCFCDFPFIANSNMDVVALKKKTHK